MRCYFRTFVNEKLANDSNYQQRSIIISHAQNRFAYLNGCVPSSHSINPNATPYKTESNKFVTNCNHIVDFDFYLPFLASIHIPSN